MTPVAPPPGHHVILVGLPGAGKTTVGQLVAQALGWPFTDLDAEIVRTAGRSIPAIFATDGEAAFRDLERAATHRLQEAPAAVIAPGGGWATVPETVALVRPPSLMAYLEVSPRAAVRRLRRSIRSRPLLRRDPLGMLERLLAARDASYRTADVALNTELLTRQEVIDKIVALVSARWGA